jgi:hypothetical protein
VAFEDAAGCPACLSPPGRRGDRMKEIISVSAIISAIIISIVVAAIGISYFLAMLVMEIEMPESLQIIIVSVICIVVTLTMMMKVMDPLLRKLFSPGETRDKVR